MTESPSVLLKRAADMLERVAATVPATQSWDREIRGADLSESGAAWAKLVGPLVGLPLANILRGVAFALDCHPEYAELERNYITLAKLVLGVTKEEAT